MMTPAVDLCLCDHVMFAGAAHVVIELRFAQAHEMGSGLAIRLRPVTYDRRNYAEVTWYCGKHHRIELLSRELES